MKKPRLQAQLTGQARTGREIGPEEAHKRNVLAITRRIHSRSIQIQKWWKLIVAARKDNRADRRELRAVLQRESRINVDDADVDNALQFAGHADAIDASEHRRERR